MREAWSGRVRWMNGLGAAVGVIVLVALAGCASAPATSSAPTQKEIRSDSDRFFEKLKQEEREHGKGHEGGAR